MRYKTCACKLHDRLALRERLSQSRLTECYGVTLLQKE
ncbi:hypothetical protein ATPR_0236 [Acetobacter tropicalis NBRC 101654]|uniref:Uncharacterized protein n=1 Tax=Acetobacter tropicalis NBRC 101654 TaxID=749388 RepID=F7VA37_9PROT|nr:hypothetical protein ATPR_0236 [Acetobacter tropicalis NBRC 101654]